MFKMDPDWESLTLATPHDSENTNTPPGNSVANDLRISPDGTKIYYMAGTTLYLTTMSTPYDLTTIGAWSAGFDMVFDVVSADHFYISADAQKMWVAGSGINNPIIGLYERT
jgi:hypothetical protein